MNRSVSDSIRDLIDATERIDVFVERLSYKEFSENIKTIYAVSRALEIIG